MANEHPEELDLKLDSALVEFMRRADEGQPIDREEFLRKYAPIADQLRELLSAADCIELMAGPTFEEIQAERGTAVSSHRDDPANGDRQSVLSSTSSDDTPSSAVVADIDQTLPHTRSNLFSQSSLPTADSTQPNLPCRFGDYILERVLGRGGMGVVYLARQTQLDRQVAIKMIRSGCLASEDEVARFYAEARSAARLDHPNIVTVYQCGECEGHHFFSMDYVPGTDLARKLAQGPLQAREAVRYVRDVALAISYAHEQGILHRDLKPANVLIDERDQVVVSDFGLAKLMGSETGLTATGAALGTPSYMSPEQAGGKHEEHGEATDVYSLGAILFALLVGKPPFTADSVIQTIMQVIHKPAPILRQLKPELHADLETIVAKCLQKQPLRRYENAKLLADDLGRYLRGEPILARPLTRIQKVAYWLQGIPIIAALTGYRSVDPTPAHRWAQRAMILLVACSPFLFFGGRMGWTWWKENHLPTNVAIAAGSSSGMYHTVADHLAKRFESQTGNHAIVVTTEGSDENLTRLLGGNVHLAMLQASSVRSSKVAVVAPLYYETLHFLVRSDIAANSLADLQNRSVAMGPLHSGTRHAARLLLEHLKLNESDFQVLDIDQSALADNAEVEAAIVMIKAGSPMISQLLAAGTFRLLPIPNAMNISLEEPAFRMIEITSKDYPNTGASPIQTLATTAFLAARTDTPSRLVQVALDSLYGSDNAIPGILTVQQASHWQGLPWHATARQFFDRQ